MTALEQYQRLEAEGVWRPEAGAQRRNVIVSFGNATLTLSDPRSEVPLSHWSLPAVVRINPGRAPARYAPDGEGVEEELEITDGDMIAAIDKVHRAIVQARPHPGRLRHTATWLAAIAITAGLVWWLPDGLPGYAARIAPPAQQAAIGEAVLADMTRLTGPVCRRPAGTAVAARLAGQLLLRGERLVVLPGGFSGARGLPGGIVAVTPQLLTRGRSEPAVVAGRILAAAVHAAGGGPLDEALRAAGLRASALLLTRGALPEAALTGYSKHVLDSRKETGVDEEALLQRFALARVSSEPYARDIDPSGEATLALIEADPLRGQAERTTLLSLAEWETLASICDE